MKKVSILLYAIIILLISSVYANERIQVKYIKTSDGDTARFEVDGENVRVRFLGINTPETAGEDKVEEPYGNEAFAYTKERLDNAKKIEIEYDDNADKEDKYGRILAYIWVDDVLFQEELVRNGYAKTYMMKANYKYADELKSAERAAKAEKLGVWSNEISTSSLMEDTYEISTEKEKSLEYEEDYDTETKTNVIIEDDSDTSFSLSYILVLIIIIGIVSVLLNKNKK